MTNQSASDDADDNPPPGYQLSTSRSAYSRGLGPFYFLAEKDCFRQGFRVRARHCNGVGLVHGGMLSTLADNTMAAAAYTQTRRRSLTVQMNLQFISAVRPGAWLEAVGRVSHSTQTMIFCEVDLFAKNHQDKGQDKESAARLVMKGTGIFRRPRGE